MPHNPPELDRSEMDRATRKIVEAVEEGLEHGFFEYSITGEIVSGGARCVTVKAGKSYRFTIRPKKDDNQR